MDALKFDKIDKSLLVSYKKDNILNEYELEKTSIDSTFGILKKGIHIKTGKVRAIKIIFKRRYNFTNFLNMITIYSKLSHPNITHLYEFFEDKLQYYIVMDLWTGGNLLNRLCAYKSHFSEIDAGKIMKQVLSAMSYIHSNKIILKNLNVDDLLVDNDSDVEPTIKINNFSYAEYHNDKKNYEIPFNPYVIAPEILKKENYNCKADIWSCGVILYILLVGYQPFKGRLNEMLHSIEIGVYYTDSGPWSKISKEAKYLVKGMMEVNPEKRFTADKCLEHEWFQKLEKNEIETEIDIINNLQKLKDEKVLESLTVNYITTQIIAKEEKSKLIAQSKLLDLNKDGQLTKNQLFELIKDIYGEIKAKEKLDEAYKAGVYEKDDKIKYNEFLNFATSNKEILLTSNLELAFKSLDIVI